MGNRLKHDFVGLKLLSMSSLNQLSELSICMYSTDTGLYHHHDIIICEVSKFGLHDLFCVCFLFHCKFVSKLFRIEIYYVVK